MNLFDLEMRWARLDLILLSVLSVLCTFVAAQIDDQSGQFVFDPPEAWITGQSCSTCSDISSAAYNKTWMNGTFTPGNKVISATVNFTGKPGHPHSFILPTFIA